MYRAREPDGRYGQNDFILATCSELSIPNLRTWVVGWNPAVGIKLNPHMIRNILYTEEANFTSDRVNKTRNSHLWDLNNPHGTVESECQHPFSVHVWCGD
jgi:hypothetical protein